MTERLPLSAISTDPIERALLRSVRRDQPGPYAMQRTAAALGLGASALAATASSAGALASSSVVGSAAVSLPWLAVKAVVLGALCGTGILVGVNAITAPTSQREHRRELAASSVVTASMPSAPNASRVTKGPSESTVVSIVEQGPIAPERPRVRVASHTVVDRPLGDVALARNSLSTPRLQAPEPALAGAQPSVTDTASAPEPPVSRSVTTSMGEEIAAIDRVRQFLQQGNALQALGELERYQARWPNGAFALEAIVLSVEAMLVSGDHTAAERAARNVLVSQPNSRYAARLRTLLGTPKSSDPNPTSSTRIGL